MLKCRFLSVVLACTVPSSVFAQTNHALNGVATQSSLAHGGDPSRAIDGNTDPIWTNMSITHTDNLLNSWWEVDLTALVTINEVRLYNRVDCCHTRLSNFRVTIWDDQLEVFGEDYFTLSGSVSAGGQHSVMPAGGRTGDRVRVEFLGNNLDGNGYLSLAEVEVYGFAEIGTRFCSPNAINTTGLAASLVVQGSPVALDNLVTPDRSRPAPQPVRHLHCGPGSCVHPGCRRIPGQPVSERRHWALQLRGAARPLGFLWLVLAGARPHDHAQPQRPFRHRGQPDLLLPGLVPGLHHRTRRNVELHRRGAGGLPLGRYGPGAGTVPLAWRPSPAVACRLGGVSPRCGSRKYSTALSCPH